MAVKLRCAIYTRKSSEEGLEQAFNSLDAQREACEAYIKSQAGEGWSAIAKTYDDGGISGGTMERPSLQRLLEDVERGLVDIVVVYKVDRLTRSLADFAKIIEVFDRKGASFVSVTQAFNTTSSMGRLTLNVLLSFAQFEREVTGERIRDKIAASKAKGMWMGGHPPLGYDIPIDTTSRALQINPDEADVVRSIFTRYLRLKSVVALREELKIAGIRSKRWTTQTGRVMGGCNFTTGSLFHLLQSRLYVGEIPHKGQSFPGAHQAIIDRRTFEAVQAQMKTNTRQRRHRPGASLPLKGVVFDAEGNRMSPAFAYGKRGGRHAYYVSSPVLKAHKLHPDTITRAAAEQLDALVLERAGRLVGRTIDWEALKPQLKRVEVRGDGVRVTVCDQLPGQGPRAVDRARSRMEPGDRLKEHPEEGESLTLFIAVRPVFHGGRTWLVKPDGGSAAAVTEPNRQLIKSLAMAHACLDEHGASPTNRPDHWQSARSVADGYLRRLMGAGFLAPDIQLAILEGKQPAGLTAQQLIDEGMPLAWEDQRRVFGFGS